MTQAATNGQDTAGESVDRMLRFAAVHAQLATSADVDREADAEVRLAACVADGGSAFDVNVRGSR